MKYRNLHDFAKIEWRTRVGDKEEEAEETELPQFLLELSCPDF